MASSNLLQRPIEVLEPRHRIALENQGIGVSRILVEDLLRSPRSVFMAPGDEQHLAGGDLCPYVVRKEIRGPNVLLECLVRPVCLNQKVRELQPRGSVPGVCLNNVLVGDDRLLHAALGDEVGSLLQIPIALSLLALATSYEAAGGRTREGSRF